MNDRAGIDIQGKALYNGDKIFKEAAMAKAPKTVRRGDAISREWSYRYRKVRGKRRLVKVRKVSRGRDQIRVVPK